MRNKFRISKLNVYPQVSVVIFYNHLLCHRFTNQPYTKFGYIRIVFTLYFHKAMLVYVSKYNL